MRRIEIDLNARAGELVPARHPGGRWKEGDQALAYEPEDGVVANAEVVVAGEQRLLLRVDWPSLRDAT